jgi:hypothetical protein
VNLGHGKNLFLDEQEAFDTIKALFIVGCKQFAEPWRDRVKNYFKMVQIVREK